MAPEKRNEFLDAGDSDEEDLGYNSEDEVTKGGRSAKRRKVDSDASDEAQSELGSDGSDDDEKETTTTTTTTGANLKAAAHSEDEDVEDEKPKKAKRQPKDELPDITRPLTKKNLVATEAAIKKSGVVYLSRIPPFMKPMKLRSLLEPYGTINRIFLAPEDPTAHARRVRAGGNKKKSYTEGWVEFVRKKDAKAVCELLNARTIGGKKGSYYHDDLWNLLYLKGFKWHNLTEQISTENAERTSRMRAEISKSTRENKEFVRNVEMGKMLDGIEAKAKAKKRKASDGEEERHHKSRDGSRQFKQVAQVNKRSTTEEQPEQVTRVLSKIF